jgi:DNA-binding CsgD family transcriptional regulator
MTVAVRRSDERLELAAPGFVGRESELEVVSRALSRPPAVVLVEGEAGIGKSRIVREYVDAAAAAGRRTLVASCLPYREPSTLAPVVDLLDQARAEIAGLPLSGLAGALRPLFPDWADDLPLAPEQLDDAKASRHRLFSAVAEIVGALGANAFVVEDVHWADEVTLELLLFLTTRLNEATGLMVTYRPEEMPPDSSLRRLSSRLPAGVENARIRLAPLGRAATARMVSSMLGGEPVTDEFAGFVHAHTDGIPLAIEESVRLLGDRADLKRRDGEWVRRRLDRLQVPPTVRDATLERTRRLSAPTRRVLDTVAVLGAADETIVALVAGLTQEQARAGLAEAEGRGLLSEREPERLSFRHVLMGRAVYEAIPGPDRRWLHRSAGTALEAASPPPLAQLIRHFQEAGETAKWAEYAERAAERAVGAGDYTAAVTLLIDVLDTSLRGELDLSQPVRGRLASAAGKAALARREAVDELHHRVVRTLRAVLDGPSLPARQEAQIRNPLGRLLIFEGDMDAARTELERAVEYLDHQPMDAARAMTYLGWALASPWPASRHLRWLRRAASLESRIDRTADRLTLVGDRAAALLMLGEEAAWDIMTGLPSDGRTTAERRTVARINANVGTGAVLWGRYAEAREHLAYALKIAESEDLVRLRYSILAAQAELDWFTGTWDGLAARAADLAHADRDRPIVRLAATRLTARLEMAAGHIGSASERFQLVLDEAVRLGALDETMEPAAALARLRLAEGRVDDALELTSRPVEVLEAKHTWVWATDIAPARVAALLAAGDATAANHLIDQLARGLRRRHAPAAQAGLALSRAYVAAATGDGAKAAAAYGRAARAWDALPRRYDALLAREQQGRWYLRSERTAAGMDLLSKVFDGLTELGASGDADRVALVLKEHGGDVRRWRGGRRGYGEQLSPREVEVVRLVVAGQTNRQIAEGLSKSPRTVDGQIRSAMQKFGVASRTALAVAAVQAGVVAEASHH